MPKIDFVAWGKVRIDGKDYWQVLIINGKVIPREVERIKQKYGTDHVVADWEKEMLLFGNPEVILIANGWNGMLRTSSRFRVQGSRQGIELKVVLTPKIITEYNLLADQGKRVNCLIHTTC